jgi:fibronectin-binding autotransporter adhesin
MNRKIFTSIKCIIIALIVTLSSLQLKAVTYTAVASGNWSSSLTWGGAIPGTTIGSADFIVIPFGFTVNLDNSVDINNALATLSVSGAITSSNGSNLTINSGALTGNGTISTNNFSVGSSGLISFSGTISSSNFTSNNVLLNLAADVNVGGTVYINGGTLQLNGGSSLNLASNGNININNGLFTLNGGLFTNLGLYNVTYTGGSGSFGNIFITNSLNNLTISLTNGSDQIDLNGDLTLMGSLTLNGGQLDLNGYDLTVNGQVNSSGSGSISGSVLSDITINTSGDAGTISFATGGNTIGNFTLNSQGNMGIMLGSNLTVNGSLNLTDGNFNLGSNTLVLVGGFTNNGGTGGSIGIGSQSGLVLNGSGDWTGLSLSGTDINNFTINLSGGGYTNLDSDLVVHGMLNISDGTLWLNGSDLTIGGSLTGSGFVYGNSSSSLIFSGVGNSNINLSANGQTIEGLTINIDNSGSLTLNSDITVSGQYQQQNGSLVLNGYGLTLNGTNNFTGGGISGSLTSSVFVNGSGNVGTIGFNGSGDMVDDFMVNISGDGWVSLASDLDVHGNLGLTNGMINTNDNDLSVAVGGQVVGGGSGSYVISGNGGHLMLNLGMGTSSTFHVGTGSDYSPVIIDNNSLLGGNFGVGAQLGVWSNGTSGFDLTTTQSMVNTGWDITSDIIAGLNVDIQAFWNSAMQVNGFSQSQVSLAHYTGGSWDLNAFGPAVVEGNGMFSITGTGYTSLSPFGVFDSNTLTSVAETAEMPAISVYPNPTTDVVNIAVTEPSKYKRVRVFNMIGAEMTSIPVTSTLTSVDMTGMAPGVYFVSIDNVTTQRIVKR